MHLVVSICFRYEIRKTYCALRVLQILPLVCCFCEFFFNWLVIFETDASYFSRAMESGKKVYPMQFLLLFLFYDMFSWLFSFIFTLLFIYLCLKYYEILPFIVPNLSSDKFLASNVVKSVVLLFYFSNCNNEEKSVRDRKMWLTLIGYFSLFCFQGELSLIEWGWKLGVSDHCECRCWTSFCIFCSFLYHIDSVVLWILPMY